MKAKQWLRRIAAGLAIGASACAVAILLPFTDVFELKTLNLRFAVRGLVASSTSVVIVSIDGASFISQQERWPWPRDYFAEAIDAIAAGGARAVGLDISLSDKGFPDQEDCALSTAMRRARMVVLPAKFGSPWRGVGGRQLRRSVGLYFVLLLASNLPALAQNAQAQVPSPLSLWVMPAFDLSLGDNSLWLGYGGSLDRTMDYHFPRSIFFVTGGLECSYAPI